MQNPGTRLIRTTVRVSFLLLGSLTMTAPGALAAQQNNEQQEARSQQPPTNERRALDPLTREEQAVAERIARNDGRVKQLLGESGVRLVSARPVLLKPEGGSPEKLDLNLRQVEVVLFHPQREVGARVVVNLQRSGVVDVQQLASRQVPMTADDLADATQLALKDAEVLRMLGPAAQSFRPQTADREAASENQVSGLPVRSTDPADPCSKHRCMDLHFRRGTDFLSEPVVVVDLTARHVYVERRKSR